MKKKLNRKKDVLAYIIYTDKDVNVNKEFTQKKIGEFFGISQSTVSKTVKELKYQERIKKLEKQIIKISNVKKLELPTGN